MKIYVCVKQVPDTETKIRLNSDDSGIDDNSVKWILNPYDENGIEEALKIKEARPGSTVSIISLGPKKRVIEAIRTGLAMGADEGIVIDAPSNLDGDLTAKALAAAIKGEGAFDILFTGKLAIDDNNSYVGQALAEFLAIPHASVVSKLEVEGEGSSLIARVEREVEGGAREQIELLGPCLIAANKGLNTPRYASLPGIMKAKKKPLKELALSELGIELDQQKTFYSAFQLPPEKAPTKILQGDLKSQVKELVGLLKQDSKVL
ncbi:MAG: electron transfer flavoprotein subunit beta/FixA family protein [Bdellovibrionales bacterium]|nr:electron transfer flavoprotein subunit beta/FixA family protein [Bdellovibrionales bacterium]